MYPVCTRQSPNTRLDLPGAREGERPRDAWRVATDIRKPYVCVARELVARRSTVDRLAARLPDIICGLQGALP
jgi:hypothetical protein